LESERVITPSNAVHVLRLSNERDVEFHLGNWGLPTDSPILVFHHGTPGWGKPGRHLLTACAERGVRVVGLTRPGYAGSTARPGRDVATVASEVEAVLDELDGDGVLVAGISGGAPHALATAALLPERVAAVASIAGNAPFNADDLDFLAGMGEDNLDEYGAALRGEAALRTYLEGQRPGIVGVSAEELAESMATLLPPVDRALVTGALADDLAEQFSCSLQHGVQGWLEDDFAFINAWGFDLDALGKRPVSVWQGGVDLMVPYAHGVWLAEKIPGARGHLLSDDGHLSIVVGRAGEIVDELLTYL
jgi:pimeloyl-ACP methyl ester carboxylesterase